MPSAKRGLGFRASGVSVEPPRPMIKNICIIVPGGLLQLRKSLLGGDRGMADLGFRDLGMRC